jgi:hypothetical protein
MFLPALHLKRSVGPYLYWLELLHPAAVAFLSMHNGVPLAPAPVGPAGGAAAASLCNDVASGDPGRWGGQSSWMYLTIHTCLSASSLQCCRDCGNSGHGGGRLRTPTEPPNDEKMACLPVYPIQSPLLTRQPRHPRLRVSVLYVWAHSC